MPSMTFHTTVAASRSTPCRRRAARLNPASALTWRVRWTRLRLTPIAVWTRARPTRRGARPRLPRGPTDPTGSGPTQEPTRTGPGCPDRHGVGPGRMAIELEHAEVVGPRRRREEEHRADENGSN